MKYVLVPVIACQIFSPPSVPLLKSFFTLRTPSGFIRLGFINFQCDAFYLYYCAKSMTAWGKTDQLSPMRSPKIFSTYFTTNPVSPMNVTDINLMNPIWRSFLKKIVDISLCKSREMATYVTIAQSRNSAVAVFAPLAFSFLTKA